MELRNVRRLSGVRIAPYDISGGEPGTHLGLPSATATLIVDLADGLNLSTDSRPEPTTFRCCIAGMHLRPVTIHHEGFQRGVQLDLSPAAVQRLVGMPIGELADDAVELTAIDADFARRLHERVAEAPPDRRRDVCADAVTEVMRDDDPAADAHAAWELIVRTGGQITVADLVERSGWSARYLTKLFTAEFGVGPKQAARLVRFDTARAALESGASAVDVAADCGYADQSHMSREFTALTGHSPRSLMRWRSAEFG